MGTQSRELTPAEQALVEELGVEQLALQAGTITGAEFHCDRVWLVRFALLVAAKERKACIAAVQGEAVASEETGSPEDAAYNGALEHAADAIARRDQAGI